MRPDGISDLAGWMAAGLTLLTFSMRSMVPLRAAAISANVCFIVYGATGGYAPVLALHSLLLPLNLWRALELVHQQGDAERPCRDGRAATQSPPLVQNPRLRQIATAASDRPGEVARKATQSEPLPRRAAPAIGALSPKENDHGQ